MYGIIVPGGSDTTRCLLLPDAASAAVAAASCRPCIGVFLPFLGDFALLRGAWDSATALRLWRPEAAPPLHAVAL